jgi:REP element-mobilizing transposase RayT
MARPLRIEYPGAFYHVTSRGNEQKDVFKSRKDKEKFLDYLSSATVRYGAVIHVFCLMSNHYHLLLETPEGNLSQIMRHINGAYTTYFNVKRKRSGHLFQGRYKAILVEADEYAAELSRYIHLNPVKAGMVTAPEEYEWSSYRHYIGLTEAPAWLKTSFILGWFSGEDAKKKYRQFVDDAAKQETESPLKGAVASTILGRSGFLKLITETYLGEIEEDRNLPAVRKLNRPTLEEIIGTVETLINNDVTLSRKISIYFCQRYSGARLREIGERFGLSDAAVSQVSKRLRAASENDVAIKKQLKQVENKLGIVPR